MPEQNNSSVTDKYLTVTALTKYIKYKFDCDTHLKAVFLRGEITNFKRHAKGHLYFTIKDENAQIDALMFSSAAQNAPKDLKDGVSILATGYISVYEASGKYQIYVQSIELDGLGILYQQFEELKKKLEEKGYFDPKYKKSIPSFPKRIGVITSDTGAVIRDIIHTVTRRYPYTKILLYPTLVQGPDAPLSIAHSIEKANQDGLCDCLIVGRGGGSFEDLFCFNTVPVAQAVFQSKVPVISAVGHETDFTICDFISDLRAPTPTAAAELATPNQEDLAKQIQKYRERLDFSIQEYKKLMESKILFYDNMLDSLSPLSKVKQYQDLIQSYQNQMKRSVEHILEVDEKHLDMIITKLHKQTPLTQIQTYSLKLQNLCESLKKEIIYIRTEKINSLSHLQRSLELLNPYFQLNKGYSIVESDQKIISSIEDIQIDQEVKVTLKDGKFVANVIKKENHYGK